MTTILIAVCIQYASCVGLYHSSPKRTSISSIIDSPRARLISRSSSILMLVLSAALVFTLQGWERGIATWLALITATGVLSLFISAYASKHHLKSASAALVLAALTGLGSLALQQSLFGLS